MCTVRVDSRLHPGPAVHQLCVGVSAGYFADHCLSGMNCDLVLRHTLSKSFNHGGTAKVADPCTLTDQCKFFSRLIHAKPHCNLTDINQFSAWQRRSELLVILQRQMIRFDPNGDSVTHQLLNPFKKIVLVPVRIDKIVVAESLSPRLCTIDIGADACQPVRGDHTPIITPESGIYKVCEIIHTVHRSQYHRLDPLGEHVLPHRSNSAAHFLIRKGRLRRLSVL